MISYTTLPPPTFSNPAADRAFAGKSSQSNEKSALLRGDILTEKCLVEHNTDPSKTDNAAAAAATANAAGTSRSLSGTL